MHHVSTHSVALVCGRWHAPGGIKLAAAEAKRAYNAAGSRLAPIVPLKFLRVSGSYKPIYLYVDSVLTREPTGGHEGVSGTPIVAVV